MSDIANFVRTFKLPADTQAALLCLKSVFLCSSFTCHSARDALASELKGKNSTFYEESDGRKRFKCNFLIDVGRIKGLVGRFFYCR